jgi:hypothetical protein
MTEEERASSSQMDLLERTNAYEKLRWYPIFMKFPFARMHPEETEVVRKLLDTWPSY